MRLLLDTHSLIWAVDDPSKLGPEAADAVQDQGNELLLSAGSIWEASIKVGLRKLELSLPFPQWMSRAMADLGVTVLPITVEYADAQMRLPPHHGDPFDRLLAGQAKVENVSIVSGDPMFDRYGIPRLW